MLDKLLNGTSTFYFSYNYDLTHTVQRLNEAEQKPDERFLWNSFLLDNLNLDLSLKQFNIPLIHGFVSINNVKIKSQMFQYCLISRRSCLNAGTRFNARGSDQHGNVANFVETEQIIFLNKNTICSYVIIRGSIPLKWTQKTDLKYKPQFLIEDFENQLEVCQKHFANTQPIYKQQVCVNLINKHGSEGILEINFNEVIRNLNDPLVRYEAFDFHQQCGKHRWDKLEILMNTLANDRKNFEYFLQEKNETGDRIKRQKGVFRINCVDCLDRTNVVQGLMSKKVLVSQLIDLKILKEYESIESHENFYSVFRNAWADNGDTMSEQYAGN